MQPYIAAAFYDLLAQNQLNTFEQLWAKQIDWFEPPNENRGGWSGVSKLILQQKDEQVLDFFVKKQQNYGRRSRLPPYQIEPTFRREFKTLLQLEKLGFGAPQPVYYAERVIDNQQQAILMTRNLTGFVSLTDWLASNKKCLRKRQLINAIAVQIKRFHDLGFLHRALYAKHIFVKPVDQTFEIALIDFEKTRRSLFLMFSTISDLITLNYRTDLFSQVERLYFYQCYFKLNKMSFMHKKIVAYIKNKSDKKRSRSIK